MDICSPGICTKCEQRDPAPARRGGFRSDSDVFESLVRRHHSAVATYALAVTRNRWQADEAIQDTFVRAWKYLDSFRGDGCFEGWLLRICRNCISTNARKASQQITREVADQPVSSDSRTEVLLILAGLPLPQREALTLCRLLGYSYEGAAEVLGVPVGTIRSRIARGRASLEEQLEQGETA